MDDAAALQAYYARDEERDRLTTGLGRVEFARTVEVIGRALTAPPAIVADIGGGPGRYTDWLVEAGYSVIHRDIVEHHVEQVRARHGPAVDSAVGDACRLDLDDSSVDAVLLLGPLYHLPDPDDRVTALREACRVVRTGGHVYSATITRWAARLHGMLVQATHEQFPALLDEIDEMERTGWMKPIIDGGFTGYAHTPDQVREEIAAAGLNLDALVNLEGIAAALSDVDERMDDPARRTFLLDTLRAVESQPDLLGTGPHLLAVARRP